MNYSGGILTTCIQPSPDIQEVAPRGIIDAPTQSSSFQGVSFLCKSPLFQSCHKAFQDGSGGHLTTLCVLRGLRTQLSLAFRQTTHKSSWQRFSFQAFFATIIISSQRLPERRNIWKQRVWRYFCGVLGKQRRNTQFQSHIRSLDCLSPFAADWKDNSFTAVIKSWFKTQNAILVSIESHCC